MNILNQTGLLSRLLDTTEAVWSKIYASMDVDTLTCIGLAGFIILTAVSMGVAVVAIQVRRMNSTETEDLENDKGRSK